MLTFHLAALEEAWGRSAATDPRSRGDTRDEATQAPAASSSAPTTAQAPAASSSDHLIAAAISSAPTTTQAPAASPSDHPSGMASRDNHWGWMDPPWASRADEEALRRRISDVASRSAWGRRLHEDSGEEALRRCDVLRTRVSLLNMDQVQVSQRLSQIQKRVLPLEAQRAVASGAASSGAASPLPRPLGHRCEGCGFDAMNGKCELCRSWDALFEVVREICASWTGAQRLAMVSALQAVTKVLRFFLPQN